MSDWVIEGEVGLKFAARSDFLRAVAKKLGILVIPITLVVEAISLRKSAQIKS